MGYGKGTNTPPLRPMGTLVERADTVCFYGINFQPPGILLRYSQNVPKIVYRPSLFARNP